MKSAKEWTKLMRDDVDMRLARRERPEDIDGMIERWLLTIQADAAADMRERAAKRLSKAAKFEEENGNQFPDQLEVHMHAVAVLKTVAVDVRALPLEES